MCNYFSCVLDMFELFFRDFFFLWLKGFSFDYDEEIIKLLGYGCSVLELKDIYMVNFRIY